MLTVAALPAFATGWLLPRISRFRERYPRIDLMLKTSRALADFRREDIDVAIRFGAGTGTDTKSVFLMGEEVFPVASPTLVAPSLLPMTVADLRALPLLGADERVGVLGASLFAGPEILPPGIELLTMAREALLSA